MKLTIAKNMQNSASTIAIACGVYRFLRYLNRKKVRIIMYHNISDYPTKWTNKKSSLNVKVNVFERQIKFLKENYNVISLHDLVEHQIPKNALIITFDDGFYNNYRAFQILNQYDLTASFFIVADSTINQKINSKEKLSYIINKKGEKYVELVFKKRFPNHYKKLNYFKAKDNNNYMSEAITSLLTKKEIDVFTSYIFKEKISKLETRSIYLNRKQIEEMTSKGMTIGNHSLTHPILSKLNISDLSIELAQSKKQLENSIKKRVDCFAIPYGITESYNESILKEIKKTGYSVSLTAISGLNDKKYNIFELKRISVIDEPLNAFKLRIEGFYGFLENLLTKVKFLRIAIK